MSGKLVAVAVGLYAWWIASGVYADEYGRQSLQGLEGVAVLVEDMPEALRGGVTPWNLQSKVELRLRAAGIPVLNQEELRGIRRRPCLYVNVNALKHEIGLYACSMDVNLRQNVLLLKRKRAKMSAITWEATGRIVIVAIGNLQRVVTDSVEAAVDEFINDYLAANPKE